jgi:hypothetical protein
MPATLEEFESVISQARASGGLSPEQIEVLQVFFSEMGQEATRLYEAAILVSSHMYDRQKIADFWRDQRTWFEAQLAVANRTQNRLTDVGQVPFELKSIIRTLEEIVDAAAEHYEFHA